MFSASLNIFRQFFQMEEAMSSGVADSMAVTVKRKELSEKYPGVESSWLENIFMSFK